jgi:hypothetical protein
VTDGHGIGDPEGSGEGLGEPEGDGRGAGTKGLGDADGSSTPLAMKVLNQSTSTWMFA